MLELMTEKALDCLSSSTLFSVPFILMVEAASIDKQSHPNQAAGTIWDAIEMDKAVGVARKWAAKRTSKDTLIDMHGLVVVRPPRLFASGLPALETGSEISDNRRLTQSTADFGT